MGSRRVLRLLMDNKRNELKLLLRRCFRDSSRKVSLTTDVWTAVNGTPYMAAHFLRKDTSKMANVLLNFVKIPFPPLTELSSAQLSSAQLGSVQLSSQKVRAELS